MSDVNRGKAVAMNSCLYECRVMHRRITPTANRFEYSLFMACLDLDEVEGVSRKLALLSRNRWNLYSFFESDHEPAGAGPLKDRVLGYLRSSGVDPGGAARVFLLTLPRVLGFVFNPIAVYYCFDGAGAPVCAVAEVGNTFGEKKLFLVRPDGAGPDNGFRSVVPKHFYVSPFSPLDLSFDFRMALPSASLSVRVDEYDGEKKVLASALTGRRVGLSDAALAWFAVKYPLLTLKVVALIHWQALRLWLRRTPYFRKSNNQSLQREVLRPHPPLGP